MLLNILNILNRQKQAAYTQFTFRISARAHTHTRTHTHTHTFLKVHRTACAAHRYSVYLRYRYKSTNTDVPALTARATAKEGVNVRASSHLYFFGGTPPSSEGGVPPESVSELTVSVYGVGVSMCTLVC